MQFDKNYILVVDDSFSQQILIRTCLEANGYNIDCSSNGADALRLLRSSHNLPKMILLDLRMPIMGGFDFRAIQMQDERLRDIPVVIMTAEDDIEQICARIKANNFLSKPFKVASLLDVVAKAHLLH